MRAIRCGIARTFVIILLVLTASIAAWLTDAAAAVTCNGTLPVGGGGQDLNVTGPCVVAGGTGTEPTVYQYGNVNIYVNDPTQSTASAYLKFADAKVDFWAHSILVENKGQLLAGVDEKGVRTPIGTAGGQLRIYIWGKKGDTPIACKSVWNKSGKTPDDMGPCGIEPTIWKSNMVPSAQPTKSVLPAGVNDYFYNYSLMNLGTDKSFFGSKVIAVSFGGAMKFAGARGASYRIGADTPSNTGTSWVRLNGSLNPQDKEMVVNGLVDWQKGDHIVITSTDYIPGHAEELLIQFVSQNATAKTTTIRFTNVLPRVTGVKYSHNGTTYNLANMLDAKTVTALGYSTVETRAAVGLLTRSIQILSAGDMQGDLFPTEDSTVEPNYFFGAHTIVRQGFLAYQLQGVSFYQMGQGGAIGRYPVHFHMVRQAPNSTYVKDCSVWDSMTRWMTLHATQNVILQRNVGYKSIGHGYYIEDGTEANNQIYANLGVLARAAVANKIVGGISVGLNPRSVPGILAAADNDQPHVFPYHSDTEQPSVFWIMNGWNDFEYNMAAGAGGCGACYWLLPGYNSGPENTFQFGSDPNKPLPNSAMTWRGYPSMQGSFVGVNGAVLQPPRPPSIAELALGQAGTTPLQKFVGNSCTSGMNSFITVGGLGQCHGVQPFIGNRTYGSNSQSQCTQSPDHGAGQI
jgi:hypothetical protein